MAAFQTLVHGRVGMELLSDRGSEEDLSRHYFTDQVPQVEKTTGARWIERQSTGWVGEGSSVYECKVLDLYLAIY